MRLHRRALLKGFGCGALGVTVGASLLVRPVIGDAGTHAGLPRSAPEKQGISSDAIVEFLAHAEQAQHELHGFVLVRHGCAIAEAWWAPYRRDAIHSLYSLSKSFTATAVGFAVAEGKLRLNDSVIGFFPEKLPPEVGDNLCSLRVEHLLTMSTGHQSDPTYVMTEQGDWVRAILAAPIENAPGSTFFYNTAATYLLSAIVQKVSGQKLVDYLETRLFGPLEIRQKQWEVCPRGINTGGWGLSLATESLAKFGQLYLQGGRWNGKQLLPAEWVTAATSLKIQQPASWNAPPHVGADLDPTAALERLKNTSDWHQGYGYQFWRCRHGAYRGDGAFGQFCIVLPEQDAVLAITSWTQNMQGLLDLVWQQLVPAMLSTRLPEAAESQARLRRELAAKSLPLPIGTSPSAAQRAPIEKNFKLEPNSFGAVSVSLRIGGNSCSFALQSATGNSEVRCGIGKWVDGITDMPGTPPRFITVADLRPVRVAAAGVWKDKNTFQMQWRYYETPHHDIVTCRLDGDRLSVEFMNNIVAASDESMSDPRPILLGWATT